MSIVHRHATIDEMQRMNPHFYRKGIVGDWRRELTEDDARCIWDVAGEAMSLFGYARSDAEPDERVVFDPFEGRHRHRSICCCPRPGARTQRFDAKATIWNC